MSSIGSDFTTNFEKFNLGYSSDDEHPLFQEACKRGDIKVVEKLLKDPNINPAEDSSNAIHLACEFGHLEIVKLLLADGRADPSDEDNLSIQLAGHNGHYDVVVALLKDTRVDPCANHYFALNKAYLRGHRKVVEALLPHFEERVYKKKKENHDVMPGDATTLMEFALKSDHPEIVERLLDEGFDPFAGQYTIVGSSVGEVERLVKSGYDPSTGDNPIFKLFCKYERLEFVEKCLTRPRKYPTRNMKLLEVIRSNDLKRLEEILEKKTENPATNGSEAIHQACLLGRLEIVKRLLADGRADPTLSSNLSFKLATWKEHKEITMELLHDPRVKSYLSKNKMTYY